MIKFISKKINNLFFKRKKDKILFLAYDNAISILFEEFKKPFGPNETQESKISRLFSEIFRIEHLIEESSLSLSYKNDLYTRAFKFVELLKASDVPYGLEINSMLLNYQDLKEVGIILSKQGFADDVYFLLKWFKTEFFKYSNQILFENDEFLILKIDIVSPLIYISNLTFNLENKEILFKREFKNNIETEKFFFDYVKSFSDVSLLKTIISLN